MNDSFITKANDDVISNGIIGHNRRERYATLDFTLCNNEKKQLESKMLKYNSGTYNFMFDTFVTIIAVILFSQRYKNSHITPFTPIRLCT